MHVNFLAIVVATTVSLGLGSIWYSPVLFGKVWQRASGTGAATSRSGNMALTFGGAFALMLVASFVFAMFLGPRPSIPFATGAGFAAGLCWVTTSFGVNYLFERRSFALFAINGGFHTLQFTLMGLILGVLP
jgi:hypothetical protein